MSVNRVVSLDSGSPVERFFPLSLAVSFVRPKRTFTHIPAESARYFDLGNVRLPFEREAALLLPAAKDQPGFWFDTPHAMIPAPGQLHSNQLEPGRYELELVLTGENVRSQRTRWQLELEEVHLDDEESLRRSVKIVKVGSVESRSSI
jgi:hypothetical protein